jgi:predicted nucleic acid-binding protein
LVRRFLFDTGPLTSFLEGRSGAEQFRPLFSHREVTMSFVVYGEVVEHYRSQPDFTRRYRGIRRFMAGVHPIGLSYPILDRYAELRRQMRRPFGPGTIGDIDTLIAATALERDLTVVTTDGDFMRVPELKVLLLMPGSLRPSRPTT